MLSSSALLCEAEYSPQRATELAAEYWGIAVSDLRYSPEDVQGYSAVTELHTNGSITITTGDGAMQSPEWLLSTMGHEGVHVGQFRSGNFVAGSRFHTAINEVEAGDFELARAQSLHVEGAELTAIKNYRSDNLSIIRGSRLNNGQKYYGQVLNRNYSVR